MEWSELQHLAHSQGWDSEYVALRKVASSISAMKAKIFHAVMSAGAAGLTPDEYCDQMTRGLINTVRRRFTDLWKDGVIRHHPQGAMRLNANGNPCVCWVVGCDPQAQNDRMDRARVELQRLRAEVARLKEEARPKMQRRKIRSLKGQIKLF